jgi:tetratricopeptide (TPR) repeat protein
VKEAPDTEPGLAPIVTPDAARKGKPTKSKAVDPGKSSAPPPSPAKPLGAGQSKSRVLPDDESSSRRAKSGDGAAVKRNQKEAPETATNQAETNSDLLPPIVSSAAARNSKAKLQPVKEEPAVAPGKGDDATSVADAAAEPRAASEDDNLPPIVTPKTVGKAPRKTLPSKSQEPAPSVEIESNQPSRNSKSDQRTADPELEATLPTTGQSKADAAEVDDSIVQPVSLHGVTPGRTTMEEARESLGKPEEEVRSKGAATLLYYREPFAKVEVSGRELVERIRLEFAEAKQPVEALRELGVGAFVLTDCLNEEGEAIGLSVPERGVHLYYAGGGQRDTIESISLEPIAPEPFIRRALWCNREAHLARLQDLETASEQKGDAARIAWVRSSILTDCGRLNEALESASRAVQQSANGLPERFDYELSAARLAGETGQHSRALKEVLRLNERAELSTERKAEAVCLLGTLTNSGPQPDAARAMQLHQQALQLATPLLNSKQVEARRRAKLVLWEAHLAIAREIACGSYQDKSDVVDKWLQNSRRITADLIANEKLGSAVQLSWYRRAIECYSATGDLEKVSRMTDEMLQLGQSCLSTSKDSAFSQQLEWELSQSLSHAVTAAIDRGEAAEALRLAENALGLLDASADQRELTPALKSVCGRLYFAIGTVHAAAKNDHAEGVRWYERALNCMPGIEEVSSGEMSEHGERLVSMGLTFWKAGKREQGMRFTKQGAQLVQRAVKSGIAPEKSLAIPYGNLAFMHKQLGNEDESKSFAAMAAKIEAKGSRQR